MMKPFNNHFLNLEFNITFNQMQQEIYEYLKTVNVDLAEEYREYNKALNHSVLTLLEKYRNAMNDICYGYTNKKQFKNKASQDDFLDYVKMQFLQDLDDMQLLMMGDGVNEKE